MGVLGKEVELHMAALKGLVDGAGGVLSDAVRNAANETLKAIAKVDERFKPMLPQTIRDGLDDAYNEGMNQAAYIELYRNKLTPEMLLATVERYAELVTKYMSGRG